MKQKKIALVTGDGAAPESMDVACKIVIAAAKKHDCEIKFVDTQMGYNAFEKFGDTAPAQSLKTIKELGIVFFGGVGDPEIDKTIGTEHPEMRPEARGLLKLRQDLRLLINLRPFVLDKKFAHLFGVRPERVSEKGVRMLFVRYLLEDCYYGTADLIQFIPEDVRQKLGLKLKSEVTGNEEMVTSLSYFTRANLEKYFRWVYRYAREIGLPVIIANKKNVQSEQVFYVQNGLRISKEFPDINTRELLIDAGIAALFHPNILDAIIACANLHGDLITDGAAEVEGGMGMMHSLAVNPDTGEAMFESGAGTDCKNAGKNKTNPIGRTLAGGLMLDHIEQKQAGNDVRRAVSVVLDAGYRTHDIFSAKVDDPKKILGTKEMGEKILYLLGE